jgi:hypothetical protein
MNKPILRALQVFGYIILNKKLFFIVISKRKPTLESSGIRGKNDMELYLIDNFIEQNIRNRIS